MDRYFNGPDALAYSGTSIAGWGADPLVPIYAIPALSRPLAGGAFLFQAGRAVRARRRALASPSRLSVV